ncbi:MAG: hypothetical protein IJ444_02105 [Kiritimatiellae bacterium]|nr:hypothetical protein [Kiritimatiellia bacterium]
MRLPFDLLSQNYVRPRLYLCEVNKDIICELDPISMSGSFKFNAYSELTFTIGRTYTNMITGETQINPFYDRLEALRLVYLQGFGYFEIQDPEIVSNGIREVKNITAYSLEYTLSQKYLEDFNINTGENTSVEVIYSNEHGTPLIPVSLYNVGTPGLSLLDLALEKIYGWKIGHVDPALRTMSRTFEISRASVYDFIVQDICKEFNCFAVFDTINNTISLYSEALITKHIGDGVTTTFKVSPAYGRLSSVSIDSYKTTKYTYYVDTNTNIGHLTFDEPPANGAKIEITDGDQTDWTTDVYITFQNLAQEVNVSYSADDIKTVLTVKGADDLDIREVNMGLPYIVDISYYYNIEWMGQELFDAYTEYLKNTNAYQDTYTSNAEEILKLQNDISFAENRTSLGYGMDSSVNSETVGTYYVINGGSYPNYTYKEVSLPSEYNANTTYYKINGVNVTEEKVHTLYSAVRKYFIATHHQFEPEIQDIATREETWEELLEELTESFDFVSKEFAILKAALAPTASVDAATAAVRTFLDLIWTEMGSAPLKKLFLTPYETIESTNKEAGYADKDSEYYWFYYPVTIMLASLKAAIKERQDEINGLNKQLTEKQDANAEITEKISIYNNFTPDQLIRLSSFLREDEYTDDNFVETSADTIETLMQTKQELLECGRIELSKLCEPKLAFSMDMANIYALPEFEPIVDQFQLGKLINVAIRDDYIKRARLLAVDINFDDFSDFTCEFGELTNLRTPSSIHADLLANALSAGKTVSSNLSYWNKGADVATSTDLKIQQGLLSAIGGLYTSDQSVLIDNNGILLRKVNENGEFSPYQAWLKNNTILLSDDSFKTSRTGLGEFTIDGQTFYGILAEAMFSGYIEGSKIVGGTINIGDGTFVVDEKGNVTMNAASIKGYATSQDLSGKVSKDAVISSINQSPESIAIDANKISLAGKNIDLTSDNITIDSTNFSVTKDGKITATSGEIAGWTIYPGLLRKDTTVDGVDYQIYMQSTDGTSTSNAFVVRKRNSGESDWDYQFKVNYEGKLTAKNANISGTITAQDGSIAGFNIGPGGCYGNALYKRVQGDGADYEVGLKATSGDTDLAFYVKESADSWDSNDETFFIRNNGHLYAKKADITGKITASSGKIGSWTIGDMGNYTDSIYTTYCAASTPSSSNPEYAVFMRGKGAETTLAFGVKSRTSSSTSWNDADNPFYVRKDGYVKMDNANVTGTIHASDGDISGNLSIDGSLTHTRGDYTVTLRGVQSDTGKGVFYITDNSSGSAEYPVRINGDGSARFTNVTITGSSTIASACIPNLNATKITAGTLDVDRIPNISADKITSGTINTAVLDASDIITTENFSSKTLTTGSLTVASGCRLGVASEYNALLYTSGDYTNVRAYGPDINYGISWYALIKQAVQQSASSRDIKTEIHDFDERYDEFFDNLNPQLYKYNFATVNGYSMGYIWEETKEAYLNAGLTDNDMGAVSETESVPGGKELDRTDFIALNTWQIQKLKARVEELENRLATLEA